ncbi:DUF3373 family protein [Psychromonas sp. MME2]|uniref:DUF3373 family protein n=1 Tax=unclassified Psychromonas TaxID=2614957 RepID=UPI00339C86F1
MNKKLSLIAASLFIAFSTTVQADQAQDIADLKEQVRELQKKVGGNNLKLSADYRVTMDSIDYKMADGSKLHNHDLLANRLEIGMGYQPFDNLVFKGLLSYNKAFGQTGLNSDPYDPGMGDFDWVTNENLDDNSLKVKEVYMLYLGDSFLGNDQIPWTASIGRRPSTNGFLANIREGYDSAKSPLGHSINVEFDGLSLSAKLEKITGVAGMDAKICAGRGLSATSTPRFSVSGHDYTDTGATDNIDMIGFIITPYNDGQYDIKAQYYYATNMLDMGYDYSNPMAPQPTGFEQLGDLQNFTLSVQVNGVGEFINDFLDDTVLFASVSASQTLPDGGTSAGGNYGMLGSQEDEKGYSYWLGATIPGFLADDRFGFEFNHGSKYWRSFTYGEDTLIGSKIAARGDAYEAYYNLPIIGETLYLQFRYTYIDYKYSGSNGFFGNSGAPMTMQEANMMGMGGMVADTAQDFRAMIRYNY